MDKGLEEGPWDGGEEEEATREGLEATLDVTPLTQVPDINTADPPQMGRGGRIWGTGGWQKVWNIGGRG